MLSEEENKKQWLSYVATTLAFEEMPDDVATIAERLYERGYRAYQAVEYIKRYLNVPNEQK